MFLYRKRSGQSNGKSKPLLLGIFYSIIIPIFLNEILKKVLSKGGKLQWGNSMMIFHL